MRSSPVLLLVAVGCAALLSGCGKDSTGPITPKAIAVVNGNNQTGPGGDDLPDSLRVVVTGSNNQVMPGVTVTWAAGGATVSPLTSTTDANGETAARLSLAAVGPVLVTATVAGIAPATFNATAVNPCTWLHAFGVGQTVSGILRQYDCVASGGYFIDYYGLTVTGLQQTLAITMGATFDAWIDVWKRAGPYVGSNDDESATSHNSRFKVVAVGGDYVVGANSFFAGETGPYTLAAATTSTSEENCEEVWTTRGVTTTQALAGTDCVSAGPNYDAFFLVLYMGEALDVTQTSLAFDARLELYDYDFLGDSVRLVASDDNGAGGTNARLQYTASASEVFELRATAPAAGDQGAYTLALAQPVTSAAAATGPRILASPGLFPRVPRRPLRR